MNDIDELIYTQPDPQELGEYYTRHVSAMTQEGLHEKAAIAVELAYRDKQIDELAKALKAEREKVEMLLKSFHDQGMFTHECRECGWRYAPLAGDSEDCPMCGHDGKADQ